VVKVSKAVSSSTGGDASLTIIGEKARGQLSKAFSDNLKNVILDVTKMPLSFSTASLVTDKILSDGAHKYQANSCNCAFCRGIRESSGKWGK
jgi:F-type H+-transporting ATPase subunit gamma